MAYKTMCGVVGIIDEMQVNQKLFDALIMLQHRGQDAAGILTCDGYHMYLRKSRGLVVDAIRERHMGKLEGNLGIAHVRYPTSGSNSEFEAQPFYVNSPYGIALAHNGNLINTKEIRKNLLEVDHRHINTNSDSELLLNILASELTKARVLLKEFSVDIFFDAMKEVYKRCIGGYAVVGVIAGAGLFAFRDPNGIRPLALGKKINNSGSFSYMVASETVALNCENYNLIEDISPGEAIFIDLLGNLTRKICTDKTQLSPCIFEYIYLARPDSIIDGISVYKARLRMGNQLARKISKELPKNDIDVVVPVPDSGRYAAIPMSRILNIPYHEGLVKNRYVGRTFIMPNQYQRKNSIRKKLNVIGDEILDKHVLLVDDSIVRGNTSKIIVQMIRDHGARKVSIASTSPIINYPNVYGIDMPTQSELVSYRKNVKEIADFIGVDNLFYQENEDLIAAVQGMNPMVKRFDTSIFNGDYVTGHVDQGYLDKLGLTRACKDGVSGSSKGFIGIQT